MLLQKGSCRLTAGGGNTEELSNLFACTELTMDCPCTWGTTMGLCGVYPSLYLDTADTGPTGCPLVVHGRAGTPEGVLYAELSPGATLYLSTPGEMTGEY